MKRYRSSTAALAALALAACFPDIKLDQLPGPDDYPGAHAVVLLDDESVRFQSALGGDPVADVTQHMRIRLLRPGAEQLTQVFVPYWKEFQEVTSFRARTIAPDGTVKRWQKEEAVDVPVREGFELYSDSRALVLTLTPSLPGTVIEYTYTVRNREPRLFQYSQTFAAQLPLRESRFTVVAPADWTVEHAARRLGERIDLPPAIKESGGERTFTWVRRDVPALAHEPLAPSPMQRIPRVSVRLAAWMRGGKRVEAPRDARALSAWLHGLIAPVPPDTERVRQTVEAALQGVPDDPPARARRLYGWVRDHVQYCAVEVGYGAWRPHRPGDVFSHRYGDCKDKANLLRSMLTVAGIKSRLATIHAHGGFPQPFGLPTVAGNFNHMVLLVDLPGGAQLVDPTSRTAAFGLLPASDQEADYLPITEDGSALERAPATSEADNTRAVEYDLTVDAQGGAAGRYRVVAAGHFADQLRAGLLETPEADRARRVVEWIGVEGGEWSDVKLERLAPTDEQSTIEASGALRFAHLTEGEGGTRLLRVADFAPRWVPPFGEGERRDPAVLPVRQRRTERWRVRLPGNLRLSSVPPAVEVKSELGSYRISWTADGPDVSVERELVMRERVVPPSRFRELKQLVDGVLAADARAAVIKEAGR